MSSGYYSTGNGSIASDVSLDSVRKVIEDLKKGSPRQSPPVTIFMSTEAMDALLRPSMEVTPFVADEPEKPLRFKTQFLYGGPVYWFDTPRLFYSGVDWAVGPDMLVNQVVWVEPVKPIPVPAWQWWVLAAVGAMILCLMGGVL